MGNTIVLLEKLTDKFSDKLIETASNSGYLHSENDALKKDIVELETIISEYKEDIDSLEKKEEALLKSVSDSKEALEKVSSKEYKQKVFYDHIRAFIKELAYFNLLDEDMNAVVKATRVILSVTLKEAHDLVKTIKQEVSTYKQYSPKSQNRIDPVTAGLRILTFLYYKGYLKNITKNDIIAAIKTTGVADSEELDKAVAEISNKFDSKEEPKLETKAPGTTTIANPLVNPVTKKLVSDSEFIDTELTELLEEKVAKQGKEALGLIDDKQGKENPELIEFLKTKEMLENTVENTTILVTSSSHKV